MVCRLDSTRGHSGGLGAFPGCRCTGLGLVEGFRILGVWALELTG